MTWSQNVEQDKSDDEIQLWPILGFPSTLYSIYIPLSSYRGSEKHTAHLLLYQNGLSETKA